jgi:hypothetical protein
MQKWKLGLQVISIYSLNFVEENDILLRWKWPKPAQVDRAGFGNFWPKQHSAQLFSALLSIRPKLSKFTIRPFQIRPKEAPPKNWRLIGIPRLYCNNFCFRPCTCIEKSNLLSMTVFFCVLKFQHQITEVP